MNSSNPYIIKILGKQFSITINANMDMGSVSWVNINETNYRALGAGCVYINNGAYLNFPVISYNVFRSSNKDYLDAVCRNMDNYTLKQSVTLPFTANIIYCIDKTLSI